MDSDRLFALATGAGLALILASAVSDFLVGSFWERHALLASLVANPLLQSARATWTGWWRCSGWGKCRACSGCASR